MLLTYAGSLTAVLIAFSLNYACYFSEIYRGGIESIANGQYEAGYVLGLRKKQVFKHIILKQVIKRIVPPMSNEIITLIKDTALANCIMIPEIIKQAQELAAKLGEIVVVIKAPGGTDNRLYGSVTAKDISDTLKASYGIDIDKRKISLADPIKAYGNYQADVKLYTEVTGKITVRVEK